MLGGKSAYAAECRAQGFIGTDFDVHEDLSGRFPDRWRDFNKEWVPFFLALNPEKGKVSAGLSAGQLWTVSRGLAIGDIVLSPTGKAGELYAGEVISDYTYVPAGPLPHRRSVKWLPGVILREDLTPSLRSTLGYGATVCEVTHHAEEIESVLLVDDGAGSDWDLGGTGGNGGAAGWFGGSYGGGIQLGVSPDGRSTSLADSGLHFTPGEVAGVTGPAGCGRLWGTPMVAGTFTVTLRVLYRLSPSVDVGTMPASDPEGVDEQTFASYQTYTLVIEAPPTFTG